MKALLPKIFTKFLILLSLTMSGTIFTSCHDAPDYKNDMTGNFDALCDIVADRYCFFDEKGIDWESLCRQYRAQITPETTTIQLFQIMSELLDELKDGHVNLTSRFSTSYYRKWWSDYPQDFNLRTIQQYYLNFDWFQTSGITYKMLPDKIGYMYYPSFSSGISDSSLDYILAILHESKGLIIDIRNNGGGLLTNIDKLVARFVSRPFTGGYIRHKTGPEPNAFSDPYPIEYKPAENGRLQYGGPIVILTNRACYSAANNFVAVMKDLADVWICGAKTGGGGGLPFSSELPNGWAIRFSACPITDAADQPTEFGIDPTPGFEVHATEEDLAKGKDEILDFAIDYLIKLYNERHPDDSQKILKR